MGEDLVSIIIACYNGQAFIDNCLASIVNQTYKNTEIIICDDASTDNSYSLLQKWQSIDNRIILICNDKNLYQAASRNSCISLAKGKYLLIQDIDDISTPNRISVLLQYIVSHNMDIVSSDMSIIDDSGLIQNERILKHKKFPNRYDFLWNIPFNHPASLLKTELVRKVGGYKMSKVTRRGEDYDLFMRLYAIGAKGMNVSESLYIYREDNANFKRRTFSARLDECIIRFNGFKSLNILFIGFPFVIKPILVHLYKKVFRLR